MNRIILMLSLVNAFLFGQTYNMNINLKNGTKLEFPVENIKKLTFETSTSVKQLGELKRIIESFKVYQNYPNPFNPSTTITYRIPKNSFTQIAVYDLNGSLVKELFNGFQPEGEYLITWDGTNNANSLVASGIYFYTVSIGEQIISKQMLLLR